MKPRVTLITLAVEDLNRAVRFYSEGMGLKTQGIVGTEFEHGAVAFFDLESGVRLSLWPRASLAHDSGLAIAASGGPTICLAHNVSNRAEVDSVMKESKAAGATVVKPAKETFYGGYAGYFQDPDGHLWEVAWNPKLIPAE
jgi:catechol 2,3-dioxygenase-like lactoylglutathione lyase family enzyme